MKPIPGETVMSIIYGPVNTGHLVETSKFLGREIDVWTEDRLIVINGGCEHRNWRNRPSVLGVTHKKIHADRRYRGPTIAPTTSSRARSAIRPRRSGVSSPSGC
ncbi:hypothetical protein TKK_0006594 [Trichogramma kaykai]|uniref:Uncharacterized protein n=1 Tax=Trichogramma kaykai TaxID=54128 RepID=A0ABD2XCP7_9HYME